MPGPDEPGTDQPPIEDYGVIGDCRTAALVSRDGAIDWYCLPRFDSRAIFAALLDTRRGGRFRVRPAADARVERRYLPGTNVLETTFHTARGVLRLTDAMTVPVRDEPRLAPGHEILRRVECVDGEVEVKVMCDPRVALGGAPAPGRDRGRLGIFFDAGINGLVLRSDIPLEAARDGSGWIGRERLRAGDRRYLSLTSENAGPVALAPLGDAADRRLDGTAAWWRRWLEQSSYEGEHADLVARSMLTLKLLAYPPSGAIIAAATTSLPEVPGGRRNWDYRYCWLRDASMTIEVLLHVGFVREAEAFLGWLLHTTRLTRPELQVLYDVHGRTHHPESELDHLAGYRGATPVRVGNRAVQQRQLDVYGEVLRGAWTFVDMGGDLDRAEASLLAGIGGEICDTWDQPDNGIWEVRGDRRHYTHSKALAWVGLRALLDLHDEGQLTPDRDRSEIERAMDAIRRRTRAEGWSDDLDSYVAWYGAEAMDASLLLLGITGFEDAGSDRMERTRKAVRARLDDHGLLRRYDYDDGLPGREGAFGVCAFWEAQLLALQGRVDEASERLGFAASFANDLGLFSEEIEAATGRFLGNFPQAYTHIGLVSAANEVARARGTPPEAAARQPETTRAEVGG